MLKKVDWFILELKVCEMSLNYTSTDYGRHECLSRMHEFKSKKEKKNMLDINSN